MLIDMESVLHTCSDPLRSLNDVCQEIERYRQYGKTPKVILSFQVAHLQHILNTIRQNGKLLIDLL